MLMPCTSGSDPRREIGGTIIINGRPHRPGIDFPHPPPTANDPARNCPDCCAGGRRFVLVSALRENGPVATKPLIYRTIGRLAPRRVFPSNGNGGCSGRALRSHVGRLKKRHNKSKTLRRTAYHDTREIVEFWKYWVDAFAGLTQLGYLIASARLPC